MNIYLIHNIIGNYNQHGDESLANEHLVYGKQRSFLEPLLGAPIKGE